MRVEDFEGTFGFENWRAFLRGETTVRGAEAFVYSDSRFVGELTRELGPHQLFHMLPMASVGTLVPVFALRLDHHIPVGVGQQLATHLFGAEKTILAHYSGGDMFDEVCALLSLVHGARLRAGPITREFDTRSDPRGRAITPDEAAPTLMPGRGRLVIPSLVQDQRVIGPGLLPSYPLLKATDALALVRAARSYQEAIWISDEDPQLAWLLLVSAVETAAAQWWRASNARNDSDADVLRAGKKELADLLARAGGEELVVSVASHIAQGMRAGHKFRSFIAAFGPAPREPRPSAALRLEWKQPEFGRALTKVYDHRSKALHESVPFPLPMCRPPNRHEVDGGIAWGETPGGGALFAEGGVWQHSDTPMLLWVFEHLVRGALLNWWDSMEKTAPREVQRRGNDPVAHPVAE